MPLSRPQKIHLGLILVGVACLVSTLFTHYGLFLLMGWVVLATILMNLVKCEKCGRRIVTENATGTRGWNWGMCGHCHPREKK